MWQCSQASQRPDAGCTDSGTSLSGVLWLPLRPMRPGRAGGTKPRKLGSCSWARCPCLIPGFSDLPLLPQALIRPLQDSNCAELPRGACKLADCRKHRASWALSNTELRRITFGGLSRVPAPHPAQRPADRRPLMVLAVAAALVAVSRASALGGSRQDSWAELGRGRKAAAAGRCARLHWAGAGCVRGCWWRGQGALSQPHRRRR